MKTIMGYKLIYLSTLLLAFGCSPKLNIAVSNARKMEDIKDVSFFYSLPRTHLQFHVYTRKVTLVRGPYANWSEELLGIKTVIPEDKIIWEIENIELTTYQDADPLELYGAKVSGNIETLSSLLSLSDQGLIADVLPISFLTGYSNIQESKIDSFVPKFKNLSVKRYSSEEKDTLYKTIFVDTAFIKVPVIKKYLAKKSDEEKAREAANFIIKTRKRRFKLLSGQYDVIPEGGSLEVSVEELNKVEEEYLSLFIGKTIVEKSSYVIDYIPEERVEFKQDVLFKFSTETGLLPVTSKMGVPVNITTRLNIDPNLDKLFDGLGEGAFNKGLIYRMPAQIEISVNLERRELFKGSVLVSQFGQKALMPASMIR